MAVDGSSAPRTDEAAFVAVKSENTAETRVAAQKKLAVILTGHANAEESVIYPAPAKAAEKGHATIAYTEQAAAKIQMGLLEGIPPMSQDYLDKLEHIRGAVAHQVYEEEGTWFLELKKKRQLGIKRNSRSATRKNLNVT